MDCGVVLMGLQGESEARKPVASFKILSSSSCICVQLKALGPGLYGARSFVYKEYETKVGEGEMRMQSQMKNYSMKNLQEHCKTEE